MSKIFCIGFHKTGTTTLAECLRHLGLRVCPEELSYLYRTKAAAEDYLELLQLACDYDAFEDSPWNYAKVYKILDHNFPHSKFILTVRDVDAWVESLLRWADFAAVMTILASIVPLDAVLG